MKKVLIVAYYWPPAGGPGVQRWLHFVRYLPEFGIEPILYLPEGAYYPIQDPSLTTLVPGDLKIYKHPIKEPYSWAGKFSKKKTKQISSGIISLDKPSFLERIMLWIRGNCFIPDARRNWIKPSVAYLKEVLEKEEIDLIVTTGPPHSLHLIGSGLKDQAKIRWFADFRDPWTSIGYHKHLRLTKRSQKKHRELEQKVLDAADAIIVTSRTTKLEFESLSRTPVELITNGFEPMPEEDPDLDQEFSISHIGSMLSGRNPSNLWGVLSEISKENEDFREALKIRLIGVVSDDVRRSLVQHGLEQQTEFIPYVEHKSAIAYQRRSQVLLIAERSTPENAAIIPAKLFEYMSAGRPILAIGPESWEAGEMVSDLQMGSTFTRDSKEELKTTLLKWFELFKTGELEIGDTSIDSFSRRALTGKLADLLLNT